MLPAHPLILHCPHCHGEKPVLQLRSGNTFGGHQWSDTKEVYPMLPQVSMVQKCPHCGKYYFTEQVFSHEAKEGYCSDTGELTLSEAMEAYRQFQAEGVDGEFKAAIQTVLIWAANDRAVRSRQPQPLTPEEHEVFDECLRGLIKDGVDDQLIISEYYRELGDFSSCLELLDKIFANQEGGRKVIAEMIRDHALAGDRKTFVL